MAFRMKHLFLTFIVLIISITGASATIQIIKTSQSPSYDISNTLIFSFNITNTENFTQSINLTDYYNTSELNYSSSEQIPNNISSGYVNWNLTVPNSSSLIFTANFTALTSGNLSNLASLNNGTAEFNSSTNFTVTQGPYYDLWSYAQPAAKFTDNINRFDFFGAPYVARGPGCFDSLGLYDASNQSNAGVNCCSNKGSCTGNNPEYDTDAVWVDQNGPYIAWHIVGSFHKASNLSVCDSIDKNVAFVVEFDADDNYTNQTVGTGCNPPNHPTNPESCYPGADFQLWFFPDSNETLLAYYNGSNNNTRNEPPGAPVNGISYFADTDASANQMWVYYNCSAEGNTQNTNQLGLTIIANKSVFNVTPLKLNFETNTFNVTEAQPNPIDMLTDNGQDNFLFTGPGTDAGACFQWDNTNQTACVNNSDSLSCIWSGFGSGGGLCDPDFNNFQQGENCFTINNSAECNDNENNGIGYCRWESQITTPSGQQGLCVEEFNPFEIGGGDCDSDCFNCFSKNQCEGSDANGGKEFGGCSWYNDTFNSAGWCDAKGLKFGCAENPSDCIGESACTTNGWSWNSEYLFCLETNTSEICFNGIDDNNNSLIDCADETCEDSPVCGGKVDVLTGDYKGYTPEDALLAKLTVGMGPILYLKEDLPESDTPPSNFTNITGFGLGIANIGIGMGIGVQNLSDTNACNGGVEDRKFLFLIDNDVNRSSGCNVTVDSTNYEGFDFLIKYGNYSNANESASQKVLNYCFNNTWYAKDVAIISPPGGQFGNGPLECEYDSEVGSYFAVVMLEKSAIGNPSGDVRFSAVLLNGDWNNLSNLTSHDKLLDAYYTPGTIDFEPINCFEEPTKCGSEFMILGGGDFYPIEDCKSPVDDDLDGDINCDDLDCSLLLECQGSYNASQDTTRPKTKNLDINTFDDIAFLKWVTNEPTSGSVKFYANDSSCNAQNLVITISDVGDPNSPFDDVKPFHDVMLGFGTLGYDLTPSTTYYFKISNLDRASNSALSSCLNLTTDSTSSNVTLEFNFTLQGNLTDYLGNLSIEINGTLLGLGIASEFPGDLVNTTLLITNPNVDPDKEWSIELVGVDINEESIIDFSDGFLANSNGGKGEFIGMDHNNWLNLVQKLGVDYLKITIPEPDPTLYHCNDNGTNCTDITTSDGVLLLNTTENTSLWKVPSIIGFSTYSGGAINYTLIYANISNSTVTQQINTNVTILITANNTMSSNQTYNFSLSLPNNLSGTINDSSSLDNIELAPNTTVLMNITIQANISGFYYVYVIGVLANDSSVILNSSDDLNITLNATDSVAPVISSVNSSVTETTATITWTTDELSNSSINYGTTVSLGTNSENATLVLNHNLTLSGLNLNTLYYYNITSCDNAQNCVTNGNYNFTTSSDSTAPTILVSGLTNNTWSTNESPVLNFTLTDEFSSVINYTVYVNGQNVTQSNVSNGSTVLYSLSLNNGTSTIIVEGVDSSNNVANTTPIYYTVDQVLPVSNIDLTNNGTYTNDNTPAINFTLSDNLASELTYTVYVNGLANASGLTNNNTNTFVNLSILSDGTYSVVVMATDNTSNSDNSSTLVLFVDTEAPSAVINNPSNGTNTSDNTPEINFTLLDNTSSVLTYVIYSDGVQIVTNTTSNSTPTLVNLTTLTDGIKTIVVEVSDNASNIVNSSSVLLTVDTSSPVIVINNPVNNTQINNSYFTFNLTVTDLVPASTFCNYTFVNSTNNISNETLVLANFTKSGNDYSYTSTFESLTDENYTLTINCEDNFGLSSTNSSTFTLIDSTSPVLTSISSSGITTSAATITWTSNELSNSSVNYGTTTSLGSNTGSSSNTLSHSVSLSSLSENTAYYYNVTSCDIQGNCNTSGPNSFTTSETTTATTSTPSSSSPGSSPTASSGTELEFEPKQFILSTVPISFLIGDTPHNISLLEIINGMIRVKFITNNEIVKLSAGETANIDLDNDGVYDVTIYVQTIRTRSAIIDLSTSQLRYREEETVPEKNNESENVSNTAGRQVAKLRVAKLPEHVEEKLASKISNYYQIKETLERNANRIIEKLDVVDNLVVENGKSRIISKLTYRGDAIAKNVIIIDTIPKEFSLNASNITVLTDGEVEIIEEDPVFAITFTSLSRGQEIIISYEVIGEKEVSILDSLTHDVLVTEIEEQPILDDKNDSSLLPLWILLTVIIILSVGTFIFYKRPNLFRKKSSESMKHSITEHKK